jgi:hypothetical protein
MPLAPPGAGLPPIEAWVSRHIMFPLMSRLLSWEKAAALFQREGERILALAEPLPMEVLQRPVLIRRVTGIEDSSRNWSPAMVLEHLIITGRGMTRAIVELSHGRKPPGEVNIAAVKPAGGRGREIIGEYRTLLTEAGRTLATEVGDRASPARHVHPWFGGITARQWCVLAAMHQRIHRRQLERILAGG